MSPTSISLSTFSIGSKSKKIVLNSAGQLEIDLPGSCGNIQTALDLEHVVDKAKVWVAKQGLCHFSVDLFVNGKPVFNVDTLHDLEAAMMRCDVWGQLEIGLVPVTGHRDERTNRITYSIQHPDLSSSLTPPDAASVAVLRSVLYSVDLVTSQCRDSCASEGEGVERPDDNKLQLFNKKMPTIRIPCSNDDDEEYNNLSPSDRDAVDDFLSALCISFGSSDSPCRVPNKRRRLVDEVKDVTSSPQVRILLSAWLEKILLGAMRCPKKTMTLTQSIAAPPLSQLAPGVFNVPVCEARLHLYNLNIPGPYEQCRVSKSTQEGREAWYDDHDARRRRSADGPST
ncbi:hypothetical protein E4U19_005855 [Claviceps sp. Clav32 group G5]|nr:hypothetical protein E4U19_005855 [Claviceps sp. Clav32 group G5]